MSLIERRKQRQCTSCGNTTLLLNMNPDTGIWWVYCYACKSYYPDETIQGRRESDKVAEKIEEPAS